MESLLLQAGERDDLSSFKTRLMFLSVVEKKSDDELLVLARKCLPNSLGSADFWSIEELALLDSDSTKSREELFVTGQKCNETVRQYLKRLKYVATVYYDKDELTSKQFIDAFFAGIHDSIREKVLEKLKPRISSFTGSLKAIFPLIEEAVCEFSNQGRGAWNRPRNFCFCCEVKRCPLELDDLEECLDECYE